MCQINDHRFDNETRFQILLFRERSRVQAVGLKGGWEPWKARRQDACDNTITIADD